MGIIEFFLLKCRELPPEFRMKKLEQGRYFYPGLIENTSHYEFLSLKKKKKKDTAIEKVIRWFSISSKDQTRTHVTPTTSPEIKAVIKKIPFIAALSKYILYMYMKPHRQTTKLVELAAPIAIHMML